MSGTLRKCDCNFKSKARNYMCSCRDNDCGWEGEFEPSIPSCTDTECWCFESDGPDTCKVAEGISNAKEFDPPVVIVTKLAPYTMKSGKFIPLDILLKRLDRKFKS